MAKRVKTEEAIEQNKQNRIARLKRFLLDQQQIFREMGYELAPSELIKMDEFTQSMAVDGLFGKGFEDRLPYDDVYKLKLALYKVRDRLKKDQKACPGLDLKALVEELAMVQVNQFPGLPDPYANRCFINASFHLLRETLSSSDLGSIKKIWQEKQSANGDASIETVREALSAVFVEMDKAPVDQGKIRAFTDQLIFLGGQPGSGLQGCIEFSRRGGSPSQNGEYQERLLSGLQHNDANAFLLGVCASFKAEISDSSALNLHTRKVTQREGKEYTSWLESQDKLPQLDIPLIASGSINDSVKAFLDAPESKKHPQQVEWSDLSDLPGGKYPTSFQYAFSVDLSERQDFRLCLGANKYSEFGSTRLAQRLTKSLGYVFGAIKIRAGGPAGQLRELEAKPEAMILHCGRSIMGGHF
ncbi:MAG: hypothetical protein ACR2PX_14650 [Endozoicomonas sp.]|uniref:hypothetical protein n=1 Tax=Endozoicomonas sp. TaxID=1892382 RepID=UPI003D9AB953